MKKKLNILLIYPGFPPEEKLGGGISTFAYEAANGFAQIGHCVSIISRTEGTNLTQEQVSKRITLYRLPGNIKISTILKFLDFRKFGSILYGLRLKLLINKIEKQGRKFDIIECGDWGAEGFILSITDNHRLVIRCHTPGFVAESFNPTNKPYLSNFTKWLEKKTINKCRHLTTPSYSLSKRINEHLNSNLTFRFCTYPINPAQFAIKKNYPKTINNKRPLKVFVSGRLEERKGQDIACRAFNSFVSKGYSAELYLIGPDTPLSSGDTFRTRLEKILGPIAIKKTFFLGQINRAHLLKNIKKFDVFLMTSRFESFGFVVLEAMLAGIPVIAANMCEMPRIIKNGTTGFLFQSENSQSLEKHLLLLYKNPKLIEVVGKNARKDVYSKYRNGKSIKLMINDYRQLLDGTYPPSQQTSRI